MQEVAHRVDDSYGRRGWGKRRGRQYVATRWRGLIAEDVYWRDVAQLVAFYDYAHLPQRDAAVASGSRR